MPKNSKKKILILVRVIKSNKTKLEQLALKYTDYWKGISIEQKNIKKLKTGLLEFKIEFNK